MRGEAMSIVTIPFVQAGAAPRELQRFVPYKVHEILPRRERGAKWDEVRTTAKDLLRGGDSRARKLAQRRPSSRTNSPSARS